MATAILRDAKVVNGRAYFTFADGNQLEFDSIQGAIDATAEVSNDANTRVACIGYLLARSPTLSNINSVQNKSFIFDLSAQAPIKVQ